MILPVILLCFIPFSESVAQQNADRYTNQLSGSSLFSMSGGTMTIIDDKFANYGTEWGTIETTNEVQNRIVFELDRFSDVIYDGEFEYKIMLNLKYWDVGLNSSIQPTNAHNDSESIDLTIHIDSLQPENTQEFRAVYLLDRDIHKVEVEVVSLLDLIPGNTQPSVAPDFLKLYGEMLVDRTYNTYDCDNLSTIIAVDHTTSPLGDIKTAWTASAGVDEYDLEYTFYHLNSKEGQEIASFATNQYPDFEWLFRNNATRITTTDTQFDIPMSYPSGYIFCRVRTARYKDGIRETGKWSSTTQVNKALKDFNARNQVPLSWHEEDLNWQAQVSFAEEGKNVPSINYFDGSLRQRQTITRSNSNQAPNADEYKVIVQQNIYDYHGRPAMSVMAAPTINKQMDYDPNYANLTSTRAFTKDRLYTNNATSNCEIDADPLHPNTGASNYYSDSNHLESTGIHRFIPDAEYYPYSTTEYMPDQTGRIKRQGGVGKEFQIGGGQETKYYYGKPTQRELDRLFGNEVGRDSHYLKNMVIDPNGQISVSYVDAHGRTIATALAGEEPDNTSALSNNQTSSAAPFDLLKNLPSSSYTIESTETFLVTNAGNRTFNYNLDPQTFVPNCVPNSICYDCVYDVTIRIQDNCSNDFNGGMPYEYIEKNIDFTNLATSCSASPITVNFTLNLPVGEYKVYKTLQISEASMRYYLEHFLSQTSCLPDEQVIYNSIIDTMEMACQLSAADCANSLDSVTIVEDYILAHLDVDEGDVVADASQGLIDSANAIFALMVNECEEINANLTECDILYQSLIADVTPGGGFATYSVNNTGVFTGGATGIFSTSSTIITDCFATPTNSNLYIDSVYVATTNNMSEWVWVGDLTMEQFILYWKPMWAKVMVTKHPDYSCYVECAGHGDCFEYNEYLLGVETFQDAVNAGLIDPVTCEPRVRENDPCFQCTSTTIDVDGYWIGFFRRPFYDYPPPYTFSWEINGQVYTQVYNTMPTYQTLMGWMNTIDPTANWLPETLASNPNPTNNDPIVATGGDPLQVYGDLSISVNNGSNTFIEDYSTYTVLSPNCIDDTDIQSTLENVNPSDCIPLSLTNLISTLVYCNGETPCTTPFGKGDCTTDNDVAWQTYVNFYLAEKKQLLQDEGVCSYTELVLGENNVQYESGIYGVTQMELDSMVANAQADMAAQCQTACESNADAWMQRVVDNCPLSPNTTAFITLRNRMIDICVDGCDETHPWGSTTDPDLSTGMNNNSGGNTIVSIADLLRMNPQVNADECTDCSPYLADFPGKYDRPNYQGALNATGIEQMDDCLCTNLTELENCWQGSSSGLSFDDYLNQFSEVSIDAAAIDTLQLYCASACTRLDTAIIIPPYLNCATCYTCSQVNAVKNSFTCGINVANYDEKLRLYLNYELGFTLTTEEYDDFFARCTASGNAACQRLCPTSAYGAIAYDYDCMDGILDLTVTTANLIYDNIIDSLTQVFENEYLQQCMDLQSESFEASGGIFNEYQYTLYYYDQAGNLSKTIPPQGVNPLSSPSDFTDIENYRTSQSGTPVFPDHSFITSYRYNTLNQVIEQISPDTDVTTFWYDLIGRVAASQDGRQRTLGRYSYTLYDDLGRIIEVGEVAPDVSQAGMSEILTRNRNNFTNWVLNPNANRYYVTHTFYDEPAFSGLVQSNIDQSGMNSRNRVVSVTIEKVDDGAMGSYDYATHYAYDVSGNVKTLVQELRALPIAHRFKRLDYEYDYISGNVNTVYYQKGKPDQYTYRYEYDDNNRLIAAKSSVFETDYTNAYLWETDATYQYYLHGALARTELGHNRVQGCDYAYTLQGWIKGMNGSLASAAYDMGRDGNAFQGNNMTVARDAVAYTLGYFNGDYKQIGGTDIELDGTANLGTSLYNGNIRNMIVDIKTLNNPVAYTYAYDQLHRLIQADITDDIDIGNYSVSNSAAFNSLSQYEYDANGNITNLKRYTADVTGSLMDNLDYTYSSNKNRLTKVQDIIAANISSNDYDYYHDFMYDDSGNIKQQCGTLDCSNIEWTAYGKVDNVFDAVFLQPISTFEYSPDQSRVRKTTMNEDIFYVRDAQGNVMAIYELNGTSVTWKEQYLYGSSRLGVHQVDAALPTSGGSPLYGSSGTNKLLEGNKRYELTNHLGNVLATVSDRKVPEDFNNDGEADYYEAITISAQDYYPFGLRMNNRIFNISGESSRFGFNGKELDQNGEWGSSFRNMNFSARIYSPAIARFMSKDPKTLEYPWATPYSFAANSPLQNIDHNGENPVRIIVAAYRYSKKVYKIYKKLDGRIDKLTPKHFKDAGIEEIYDIAGDLFTIFSKHSSGWDRASAAVDFVIGSDFNKKGNKAIEKMLHGKSKKREKGVYLNEHESGKKYVGKGDTDRQKQSMTERSDQARKETGKKDPAVEEKSHHTKSRDDDNSKEEEAMVIEKLDAVPSKKYYNKKRDGRSRVNKVFGGGDYKKDVAKTPRKRRY